MCTRGIVGAITVCWLVLGVAQGQDALPHGAVARLGTLQFQHSESLSALRFTPDQQTLIAASSDGHVRLWPQGKGGTARAFQAHKEEIRGLAVAPDGKTLYTASVDRMLRFWSLSDLKQIHAIENSEDGFESLALSKDGKLLAGGGRDGAILVFEVATRKKLHLLKVHKSGVVALGFSPDGKLLASGSWDNKVIVWDTARGQVVRELTGHEDYVEALVWTADGKTLVSGSKDGTIRVWDAATGKEQRTIQSEQGCVWALVFSADEKVLYAGGDGTGKGPQRTATLLGWDWKTGKSVATLPGHGLIPRDGQSDFRSPFKGTSCLALSADGKLLASGGADRRLRVWELASGKDTRNHGNGHQDVVVDVAFSDDGKLLATASRDQTVRLWEPRSGKELHALPRLDAGYQAVRFLAGSTQLLVGCGDGTLLVWDARTGKEVRWWKSGLRSIGSGFLAGSEDGKLLLCGSDHAEDRLLVLCDPHTGKEVKQFKYRDGTLRSIALSPDGKTAAAVHTEDGLLRWNAGTAQALPKIDCRDDVVLLRFLNDGKQLFGTSLLNSEWTLWDAESGKKLREGDPLAQNNAAVALSRDGKTLAVGGVNPEVRLFETNSSQLRRPMPGHFAPVVALTFSQDGRYLASASMDRTVLIWDRLTPRVDAPKIVDAGVLERAWNDLASESGTGAYDALCLFLAHPQQGLPYLKENTQAISGIGQERIEQLIRDLDAKAFKEREKASRDLSQLGRLAEKALKKALEKPPSLEVKKRIEELLSKLVGDAPTEDWVRLSRIVELLELLGGKEARAMLEKIAAGGAAPPTEEAKAALKRWPRE